MTRSTRHRRTQLVGAVAGGVAAALGGTLAQASSHREAPYVTEHPKVDATDLYAFRSYEPGREGYVTIIANYLPLQDAYGGPNYFSMDDDAVYEIHVENTGDAVEDLTFRFEFDKRLGGDGTGATLDIGGEQVAIPLKAAGPLTGAPEDPANFSETYTVSMVSGDRRSGSMSAVSGNGSVDGGFAKPFDNVGTKTIPDYDGYVNALSNSGSGYNDVTFEGCPDGQQDGRVFVGQRKDPFAISLGQVFDLVNLNPLGEPDANADDLDDKNVTTLAIEVNAACLTGGNASGVFGTWTTASRPQATVLDPTPTFDSPALSGGAYVQLSRLGNPLVNEVVIGLPDKDAFNASEPSGDGRFATYVTNPTLPALIDVLFRDAVGASDNIAPTNFPRGDLVAAFLTGVPGVTQIAPEPTASEMLRLNTGIPVTPKGSQVNLGVAGGDLAGFPNGRRPGDDVTDIALRAVMGAFCHDIPDGGNGEPANLGLCGEGDPATVAPVGTAPLTDGVPQSDAMFGDAFPYLASPLPGAGGADTDDGQ